MSGFPSVSSASLRLVSFYIDYRLAAVIGQVQTTFQVFFFNLEGFVWLNWFRIVVQWHRLTAVIGQALFSRKCLLMI